MIKAWIAFENGISLHLQISIQQFYLQNQLGYENDISPLIKAKQEMEQDQPTESNKEKPIQQKQKIPLRKTLIKLKLHSQTKKVKWIFPAIDNSFIVISQPDLLNYYNYQGKRMGHVSFGDPVQFAGMVLPDLVVVTSKTSLVIFNLRSKVFTDLLEDRFSQSPPILLRNLFIFQKGLFCIVLEEQKERRSSSLFYYQARTLLNGSLKPVHVYSLGGPIYQNMVTKGNNKSMVCWMVLRKGKDPAKFWIFTYQFVDGEGQQIMYTKKDYFTIEGKLAFKIYQKQEEQRNFRMRELSPNYFFTTVCQEQNSSTQQSSQYTKAVNWPQFYYFLFSPTQIPQYQLFHQILEIKSGNMRDPRQYKTFDQVLLYLQMRLNIKRIQIFMLTSFPFIIFDIETQKEKQPFRRCILAERIKNGRIKLKEELQIQLQNNLCAADYNSDMMYQWSVKNQELKIVFWEFWPLKDLYVLMMEEMNLDEDLIWDVILLVCQKQ